MKHPKLVVVGNEPVLCQQIVTASGIDLFLLLFFSWMGMND
jgi:hypothetical protein